jgi:hypothetical protein
VSAHEIGHGSAHGTSVGATPAERYPALAPLFTALDAVQGELIAAWRDSVNGDEAEPFLPDFFVVAAVKRSIDLVDAVDVLARRWNFAAAAALVRAHLDTLMRLSYVVEEPDGWDVAARVFEGESFRRIKNPKGQRLIDSVLADRFARRYPWARSVQDATNESAHMADAHIFFPFRDATRRARGAPSGEPPLGLALGRGNPNWREEEIAELLSVTADIAHEVVECVRKWEERKAGGGPDAQAEAEEQRGDKAG